MMKNLVLILAGLLSCPVVNADEPRFAVLRPADFEVYVDRFNREDEETQPQYIPNDSAWDFLRKNILIRFHGVPARCPVGGEIQYDFLRCRASYLRRALAAGPQIRE